MELNIIRKKIMLTLCTTSIILVIAHSLWLVAYFSVDDPEVIDFNRLIDLDYEGNIPTLFAALLFFINSLLLFFTARSNNQQNRTGSNYWLGLAAIFLFLGIDEGSRLHEEIGDLIEPWVAAEGALFFPWVIPYVAIFCVLTALYFRFYLSLSRSTQIRLFISAMLFVGGAVGVEMLSAQQADLHGTDSLSYSILYTIEECLEMAGLLLLADTLLLKLSNENNSINLKLN